MEIAFIPEGQNPVLLTGDRPEEGMDAGRVVNQSLLQVDQEIGAPGISVQDRENESNEFSFSITRTHETPGAASDYWLGHLLDLKPRVGNLRLVCKEPDGTFVSRYYLNGCGISGRQGTFDGHATTFQYTVIGGVLVKDTTPGPNPLAIENLTDVLQDSTLVLQDA